MKRYIAAILFLLPAALLLAGADKIITTKPKPGCPECFIMHPEILMLNSAGARTGDVKSISDVKTCGKCHNAEFINGHNSHYKENVKIGCVECHVEGGSITRDMLKFNQDGTVKRDSLKIRVPSNENCLRCHGIGSVKGMPVFVPGGYPGLTDFVTGKKFFDLTWKTGEIISPDNIQDSQMNIIGRDKLAFPWDIHAQREVNCVSCHSTRNDPRRNEVRTSDQVYLANDPRKAYSLSRYLYSPDHALLNADCRSCHTPEKKHKFLPYKTRHFDVLSCQSCHVPKLYGPALKSIDETVVITGKTPRYEFRSAAGDAGNMNTAYNEGYEPFLLSHAEQKPGSGEITGVKDGISPVNIILRWRWRDSSGRNVPFGTVMRAYMTGDTYTPEVIKNFDENSNGVLDDPELILTPAKIDFIKSRLEAAGVKNPSITGEYEVFRVNHGVRDEKAMKQDCYSCHSGDSRFGAAIQFSSYVPGGGIKPAGMTAAADNIKFNLDGRTMINRSGVVLEKNGNVSKRYIFGYSSVTWLNVLGFLIFIASMAGAAAHGVLRYMALKGMPHRDVKLVKRRIYPLYERVWHWGMALSVIMLIITGLEIHFAGSFTLFGFDNTVDIHNAFAVIVAVNAGLSLFYHVATGEIRQYFTIKRGFRSDALAQAIYYVYGIFRNSPHPFEKTPEKKLNPLQQATYFMLLNVLFPVQIITGIMMWIVSVSPSFSSAVGGLTVIAPVHNFFAWLFISFLVMHLYLITTGHTLFSNLKAMITGDEDVEEGNTTDAAPGRAEGLSLADIISNIKKIARGGKA